MYSPFISPEWDFAIWAVLVGIASFGFWVDSTRIGKRVSGVGIMLVSAMLLGNFGVIPHAAPAYDVVWSYLVPVAVPLLLLKVNLRRIIAETGPMLGAYFLGVTGTVIGAVLGFLILPIGDEGADLAGILSASYIGGSMNFAAVAEALEFDDGTLLTAALAADNLVGTVHLLLVVLIPSVLFLRRWIPSPIVENSSRIAQNMTSRDEKQTPLNAAHLSFALMLSLAICAAGYGVANYVAMDSFGILFVTAITLIIANIFHDKLKNIDGEFETGMLLMYVFFATIGAGADVGVMLDGGLMIFAYASLIVMTHVLVILVGAKLLKMDLAEIVIASLACIGGPVAPVAVASSRGWRDLVTPGLMAGILGYAIANFIGVGIAQVLG